MVRSSRVVLLSFMLTMNLNSCQSKIEKNTDKVTNSINKSKMETLKKYGYKMPNEELFKKKIYNVFKINIDKYFEEEQHFTGQVSKKNNTYKILIPKYGFLDESTWQPEVYLNEKYILWQDEEADELSFYHLNNYLIYGNPASFQYLKNKQLYLFELVSDFGYLEDEKLTKYVLSLIGDKLENINTETANSVFIGSNGIFGKKQLRKSIVDLYLQQYPNTEYLFSYLSESLIIKKQENYIDIYEGDRFLDAGFLLEKQLIQLSKQKNAISTFGGIDIIFDEKKEFLKWSKEQSIFKNLYNYSNEIYLPCEERETGNGFECDDSNVSAIIDDSDGYTNLRKAADVQSSILEQIKTGTAIEVIDSIGNWYYIRTEGGKSGYVHKSRVKKIE